MKILFLSTWFPYPPDNGYKLRVYHLLRGLAQSHCLTLISFAFNSVCSERIGDLDALCTKIHTVPMNPFETNRTSAARTFLSMRPVVSRRIPAMSQVVAEVLQSSPFDVVIGSTEVMAGYALMASSTTPKVLEEHNSMSRWAFDRYKDADGLVQRVRGWGSWQKSRWYEARSYPLFNLVTMVSDIDRQATLDAVGTDRVPVAVVPNGVDCLHNRPGLIRPQPRTLVYNGSLTYSANYDAMQWFLDQVYPRLRTRLPDVSLTITGSTKGVDVTGLAIDDSVHFSGYVDDVRLKVAEAAVCVTPIREGSGTRLKILEAMALGTPVVSTSKGAEGLEVVDGKHLLLADSAEAFADRTVYLLRSSDVRARLSASGRRLVERKYDWRSIGLHFTELIEETVRTYRFRNDKL